MQISRLYVAGYPLDHPRVQAFASRLQINPTPLEDTAALYRRIKQEADPWQYGKQALLLTRNKGTFLKACPGTRDYTCCGYKILHIGTYCTMDCSYCILQSYFHPPLLRFYLNHEDLMAELEAAFEKKAPQRIGTGEFTDSLIWEGCTDLTTRLIERFGGQRRAVLELKTKTTAIGHLKALPHNRKTIVSWSLNSPAIIASEERGTAGLQSRLRAAAQCQAWGYPLAFHFDPLVIYPGCENDYHQVLKRLFTTVSAENIAWISMGSMRFMPALKAIIEQRFKASTIIHGEFVSGLDGKMRYFKPLRTRLYRQMAHWISKLAPRVTVYLCMEDDQVWRQGLGFSPGSENGLSAMLDESARQHCDLL